MTEFTPGPAALGGLLIGLSAAILVRATGHVAGISGLLSRLWPPYRDGDLAVRFAFIAGIIAAPLLTTLVSGTTVALSVTGHRPLLAIAGLITGYGAVRAGGCTSGHGVCGMAQLSKRSIAATLTFMTTGALTVFLARHVMGG